MIAGLHSVLRDLPMTTYMFKAYLGVLVAILVMDPYRHHSPNPTRITLNPKP